MLASVKRRFIDSWSFGYQNKHQGKDGQHQQPTRLSEAQLKGWQDLKVGNQQTQLKNEVDRILLANNKCHGVKMKGTVQRVIQNDGSEVVDHIEFWESFLERITENDSYEGEPKMRSMANGGYLWLYRDFEAWAMLHAMLFWYLNPLTIRRKLLSVLHPKPCDRIRVFFAPKWTLLTQKILAEGGMTAQQKIPGWPS